VNLLDLLKLRSATALDVDGSGNILVRSDLTGTHQLYELAAAGGELRQLTDFGEPVSGRYLPGTRSAIVQMDSGGNERHQLYRCDLDDPPGRSMAALEHLVVAPSYSQPLIGIARDGKRIAYVSNRRNGTDFDVYVLDPIGLDETCVYDRGGWCEASSGFSPSGRYLAFGVPGDRPLDLRQLLVDLESGAIVEVLTHPDESAVVGPPAWVTDTSFFLSSNVGRDLAAIAYCDLEHEGAQVVLDAPHDLDCHSSGDGGTLLVVANEGGAASAELFSVGAAGSLTASGPMPLPERGVLDVYALASPPPPHVAEDGSSVVFSFTSPRMPSDVWRFEREGGGALERLTDTNQLADEDVARFAKPTEHLVTSFDGAQVPLFLYAPEGSAESTHPLGVVLMIHGGPEGQADLMFSPRLQALVARGLVVVVPNVRGSTGYGKRYAALDDTVKRLDSVADLAAIHEWLPTQDLDATRAVLFGGSYGGYMVLAGCAFQPELWAAGVGLVAISDLVTFLENTSDYRRSHREREYGSLTDDREFLEQASPMRSVDRIRCPIFLAHGENDPRVPVGEARQLAAALDARGVRCELVVYPDEGHGLGKLDNIVDAYSRVFDFLDEVLPAP
jgi:dipeptidyl aminopeptidase/acylaminoacyl peptidase